MEAPQLLFEFADHNGAFKPLFFKNPVEVLEARELEEVAPLFRRLEQAVNAGYYAAGYVSYEAAAAFDPSMAVREGARLPLVWFGIFKEPVPQEPAEELPYELSDWQLASSAESYAEGIRQIKEAIEEGHTYQVNFTERLHAGFSGHAYSFWRQLAANQRAGYSAYLNLGETEILSASPELFFRMDDGKLTAKPMKGTAARGRTLEEDREQIRRLVTSPKERAENLMIVDLLRNDVSRLAEEGSVHVPKLFETEKYPTVHQLTSTVKAEVDGDKTIFDWFQALFPCGSITGAPKISTMKYIADLESSPREVYCGAIGYITPEKNAVFNVPIRTVIVNNKDGTAQYGVGGGVTWDSTAEGEFGELMTKAEILKRKLPDFQLLESLKLEDGAYPILHRHLDRLFSSAEYFHFPGNNAAVEAELEKIAHQYPAGTHKVRLLLGRSGEITAEAAEIMPLGNTVRCAIAQSPVDSGNPFLFHKTTYRKVYEDAESESPETSFSTLLWNEKGEVTEFAIGNFVAEKDGEFYTPPVSCGLLAGTLRQELLDAGKITEKIIRRSELDTYDAYWFINSVRGWVKVKLI